MIQNTLTNCYFVYCIDLFEKKVNFATFVFYVSDLNINILNVLSQLSLKISMHY